MPLVHLLILFQMQAVSMISNTPITE